MNIDTNKKTTTLKYFVEAYPERITVQAWELRITVKEIGE